MSENKIDESNSVLLIGGSDAGKSNFLFRLWMAIDDGNGALLKDGLPAEIAYLRAGAETLLDGNFVDHTSQEVFERVSIPVKSAARPTLPSASLVVPDMPGEQVNQIYRKRQWSSSWEELIKQCSGCLLFLRASSSEIVAPLDWQTCFEKYGAAFIEAPPPASAPDSEPEGDHKAPTQVVMIEWLQFLRRALSASPHKRPRIGIVISAWDAVPGDQQDSEPSKYIEANFPMLFQFILANSDIFDFQIFGISIVAGDLKEDHEFKDQYLKGDPRKSGFVVHSLFGKSAKSPDITLPVAWALQFLPEPS